MCGIVFVTRKDGEKASKIAYKRYAKQSHRGTRGYGVVAVRGNKIDNVYRSVDERGIKCIKENTSDTILFHHRLPTSTPNIIECTHPIRVENDALEYGYYVIHNGIISNADTLREKYEGLGYKYTTLIKSYIEIGGTKYEHEQIEFNDSESFAIDLAIAIEKGGEQLESEGSIAFVALQYNKQNKVVNKVFFGRNDRNPLKLERTTEGIILASEGSGQEIQSHLLYSMDIESKTISFRELAVGTKPVQVEVKPVEQKLLPKVEDKVVMSSIMIIDQATGRKSYIDIPIKGNFVYKTAIDISLMHLVTDHEWSIYTRALKEIEDTDELCKYFRDTGGTMPKEDKDYISEQYRKYYSDLGALTTAVYKRKTASKDLIDEKF